MNLKNSGDSTGFEPMTSAMPVQCSNQLSYEVKQWRAGQFVFYINYFTGNEGLMINIWVLCRGKKLEFRQGKLEGYIKNRFHSFLTISSFGKKLELMGQFYLLTLLSFTVSIWLTGL